MQEINNRTQGSEERVSLYICAMEGLFNRLPEKPDEKTIVNKIRRNLLPFYVAQLALHDINTVSELTTLCKRLEESRVGPIAINLLSLVTPLFRTRLGLFFTF
nr:unnamed protein product [Callosobruchus chinensis]